MTLPDGPDRAQVFGELAIAAAGVGTFDWDLVSGVLAWDDRLIEQFGHDHESFTSAVEVFGTQLHPADAGRVRSIARAAIEAVGSYDAEYRIVRRDGQVRWISARGRALAGESGTAVRLLGATLDVTDTRAGRTAVTEVLEAMNTAFLSLDAHWRFTYLNAEAERLLGTTRAEVIGRPAAEVFPEFTGSDFERRYREALERGELVTFDACYPPPLDAWYELRALPTAAGLSIYFLDITERRRAQEKAERAARRASLVARVTSELAEHLDAEQAVSRLAQLVVPELADWSIVTLVDDEPNPGQRPALRDVGWWHRNPFQLSVVERYAAARLKAVRPNSFLLRALRTGAPVVIETDATTAAVQVLEPGEATMLVEMLAPAQAVVLPLVARGRTVGLLSLFSGQERGRLGPEGLETAVEVSGRAALALDNSRLYRQQLHLAEGLQRSLLTPPPEPDHVEVAVRYAPAAEAAQVGGDWYDAFLQPDGATVVVIGDVIGHDTEAAAAMGQVRTLVRAVGAIDGHGPAEILSRVDRLLETLRVETTATVVVARLEQSDAEREAGLTRVRWANAGHLPPVVIDPDGSVRPFPDTEADLLLGVLPGAGREETVLTVARGTTILLYTDGLVERRDQPLERGLQLLRRTVLEIGPRTLDGLCDELLQRMLPVHPEDDVALLALRLHPEDRPRPPEAGRERLPG